VVLLLIPAVIAAVVIGVAFGWKWVLAPLLGWALFRWSMGMLRAMVHDGRAIAAAENPQPRPVGDLERILYWCEDCGTELVLVVRGSGKAPRHCGTAMHERAELLSN
jgi:hypothetical protein